ncbi:hypothetical protein GCM10010313_20330 [Streptomyces violarus]|uniref:Uncharacterized protein n=1 Tax=Streptomyces violarus TaxID=67380 RepID=A0A7W5F0H6_9ACTN|nr:MULTISPECIES: hypothetical protein [Streptomyces]MBB3075557.1 hypothetical protein [Streptomyces violarus]WRT98153.1 hypothetical protein VJ737_10855 [Streptomyces sp. CGMCC 4.1772]GHD04259.1 hypothetical protein GCM10010313_20330 [Streptomyces violarus]
MPAAYTTQESTASRPVTPQLPRAQPRAQHMNLYRRHFDLVASGVSSSCNIRRIYGPEKEVLGF